MCYIICIYCIECIFINCWEGEQEREKRREKGGREGGRERKQEERERPCERESERKREREKHLIFQNIEIEKQIDREREKHLIFYAPVLKLLYILPPEQLQLKMLQCIWQIWTMSVNESSTSRSVAT